MRCWFLVYNPPAAFALVIQRGSSFLLVGVRECQFMVKSTASDRSFARRRLIVAPNGKHHHSPVFREAARKYGWTHKV